uniref:Uncharacterized protein n=1 Tax=Moniliophthora roreri TaxID=221103 RepID=A0A0W0FK87_MONRR
MAILHENFATSQAAWYSTFSQTRPTRRFTFALFHGKRNQALMCLEAELGFTSGSRMTVDSEPKPCRRQVLRPNFSSRELFDFRQSLGAGA